MQPNNLAHNELPYQEVDFRSFEKGELHVHLNGLVSTETIKEILEAENLVLPVGFNCDTDLNHLVPCASLEDYLKPWNVLNLIPNQRMNLTALVEDAFVALNSDRISFVELRNSVLYLSKNLGVSVEQSMQWLIDDISFMQYKYGIKAGLILTVSRSPFAKQNLEHLLTAYKEIGCPELVRGLDLAGNEDVEIDKSISQLFVQAKEKYGLGITIHAGETGSLQNIVEAIELFRADRIGHGTAASKNQGIMEILREKDICVEVCPISNKLTNAVKVSEAHPMRAFLEHDVPFVICSDNPAIHKKSLSDDYSSAFSETKSMEMLKHMFNKQKKYSFISL